MIQLAVGKIGSGKSAILRKLAWRVLQGSAKAGAVPRIYYHDPQCDLSAPAHAVFTSAQQWRDRAPEKRPALSVFRFIDDVDELGQLALETGNCTLILDEIDRAFESKRWSAPHVRKIVHEGRHPRVNLWGGARRIGDLGEDIIAQASRIYLFRHSPQAVYDLQRIERSLGPQYAAFAQAAQFGEFVIYEDR